jgi:protein-S-isoprenylcysteine O-methyltransferase Ste14
MRNTDHADVAVKPPILFLAALALGYALTRYVPIGPGLASPNGKALTVGLIFVVAGFALAFLAARRFRLTGTSVIPGEPASALVTVGVYRVTRNPMYIGFILLYFGLSIVLTSVWILLLLIPVVLVLHRGVVLREEAYLARKFGDDYTRYAERVPRWL